MVTARLQLLVLLQLEELVQYQVDALNHQGVQWGLTLVVVRIGFL
jgi:uncharacterized membrane protein (DUF441 family)